MEKRKQVQCRIRCQKGKTVDAEVNINAGVLQQGNMQLEITETVENGCRLGQIYLQFSNEVHTDSASYLQMENPIQLYLPMPEQPQSMTAMYMFNEWWTRPAFIRSYGDIPGRTQVLFLKYPDRYACFLPMVGRQFKSVLSGGTQDAVLLEMTARVGGQSEVREPLYLLAEASSLDEAVQMVFRTVAKENGIPLRQQRRLPEMFQYLGWCSWDAFYSEVTDEKVRRKAEELSRKQVPVRWLLIDDGWLSVENKRLSDFIPDRVKFPEGFHTMAADIKTSTMVRWIGVWHALGGYWYGVAPKSPLARREQANLTKTIGGNVIPSPTTGEHFYRHWYDLLRRDGIDFVKVDGQSSAACYFENSISLGEAARGIHQALEGGASRMDGAIINCMGMAMENIVSRPASALSRNSDDFVPDREGGFAEHLLQNAYNALYHNTLYCCDWDMFWTKHPDGVKHSLLRAVSGGPVYFSDRIGDTDADILKPLAYLDGKLLMMSRSAMPTSDCVFSDPMKTGVLKLHNAAPWGENQIGGGIAAYNLTGQPQTFSFTPADIPELTAADRYWLLDYFSGTACALDRTQKYERTLDAEGYGWYVILPQLPNGSCFGRMDKYVGFAAVESMVQTPEQTVVVVRESGTLGWMSEKAPQQVLADGMDVTEKVQQAGCLYTLPLPERQKKAVLTILW